MVSYDTDYGENSVSDQADASITRKILLLCQQPRKVTFTGSATCGYLNAGLTKNGALQLIHDHIREGGKVICTIQRTTGKPAYEMFVLVNLCKYYVKVQFEGATNDLVTISFHPAKW